MPKNTKLCFRESWLEVNVYSGSGREERQNDLVLFLVLNTGKHCSLRHIQGIKRNFFPLCVFYLVITCFPLFYSSLLNSAIYDILFPQNRKKTNPGNNVFNRLQSVSQFFTGYTAPHFYFTFTYLKLWD